MMTTENGLSNEQADRIKGLIEELLYGEHAIRLRAAITSFAKRIAGMSPGPQRDNEEQWQAERVAALELEEQRASDLTALLSDKQALERDRDELRAALTKIDAIRNSIIGCQSVNFSEHVYPLVAALQEAGFEGLEYAENRKNVGTLIDQIKAAESALTAERVRAEGLEKVFASRAYVMSEPHLSGHRVVIGFEGRDDAWDAHTAVAALTHPVEPGQ